MYVDYLQNILGKTLATAYSARASDYAGVSTPLTWAEVARGVDPNAIHDSHGAGAFQRGRRFVGAAANGQAGGYQEAVEEAEVGTSQAEANTSCHSLNVPFRQTSNFGLWPSAYSQLRVDPMTIAGVTTVLALSATVASLLPAWRAATTDPVGVLRN